jgi:3-isopropylmalate/(R)-2-methylmalate dehydratase small subunit
MKPFMRIRSRAVVLDARDIDTDRVIPARFLKGTSKDGLGQHLFADWPDFPREAARGAEILVAGANFGCGSSREHAVWALLDFGFRAVIAPSFADIFRGNALKNGLLPIALPSAPPAGELTVDLETQTVVSADSTTTTQSFTIEPFARRLILAGQDELGYLLGLLPRIEKFESCA